MDILINHCWCSSSIWGGEYNCRSIVTIKQVAEGKTVYDTPDDDWINLLDVDKHNDIYRLKPVVVSWLDDNVKYVDDERGWAVGSDEYNSRDHGLNFNVFFKRRKDGMNFIKHWSVNKKPVRYFNYFSEVRLKLNRDTGRLSKLKDTDEW